MALEYDLAKQTSGLELTPVVRGEDQTDEQYLVEAHHLAQAAQEQLGQIGITGSVGVVRIDAPTPAESQAHRDDFHASGLTPDQLPTLADVLADI